MTTIIKSIEDRAIQKDLPSFAAGDRVRVHFQVVEGNKKRAQIFEGVVIKRQGSGARETFTVRKQSFGVGVERTFPVHSPKIEKLEIAARGRVRRAKLYYLRDKVGKQARVAERRWGITDEVLSTSNEVEATDAEGATLPPAEEPAAAAPSEETATEAAAEDTATDETAEATPQAENDSEGATSGDDDAADGDAADPEEDKA